MNGLTVDLSALRKNQCKQLKHNLDNITSQKWGTRDIGEPHNHKSGGLEPLGPIGVYAYGSSTSHSGTPDNVFDGLYRARYHQSIVLVWLKMQPPNASENC